MHRHRAARDVRAKRHSTQLSPSPVAASSAHSHDEGGAPSGGGGDDGARAVARVCSPTITALPEAVFRRIAALLPVPERLRAREVSCAWRAVLSSYPALWASLDVALRLTVTGNDEIDVAVFEDKLRAVAALARGELRALRVHVTQGRIGHDAENALTRALAAHAGTLEELDLRCFGSPRVDNARALLAAAPRLHSLQLCAVTASVAEARAMMSNEPPFKPLRLHTIRAFGRSERDQATGLPRDITADLVDMLALAAGFDSLRSLAVNSDFIAAPTGLDAVADAAHALQLHTVELEGFQVGP